MDIISLLENTNALLTVELEKILATPSPDLDPLYDAMRYSALSAGKRIRPHLVLEFCRLFGGNDECALPFACAIELVHASSLVHDDMPCMDNDDYRRGRLTCHKVYGDATALLCGDALILKGCELAASNEYVSPEIARDAAKMLLGLAGGEGMMGGQNIDLCAVEKSISFEELLRMHSLKTGALMRASALLGCLAAGVPLGDARADAAEKFASSLGLCFQITDDILDAGTEEGTTFLSFMSIDDARAYAEQESKKAISFIENYAGSESLIALCEFLLHRKK